MLFFARIYAYVRACSVNVATSGGYTVYVDPNTFYTALSEFMEEDENAGYLSDVIFSEDGTIKVNMHPTKQMRLPWVQRSIFSST